MKNIIKKTLAMLVIMLFATVLNACSSETSSETSLKTYEGGLFTININPEWKIITESDFYAEIPEETVVAFTTPEAYDGFFINVNIIQEELRSETNPIDYARANINLAAQNLTDYKKVQEATVDIGGKQAMVHIFQARLNPTEKIIRFIQLYTTSGKTGYIVSGGMLPSTPENIRKEIGNSVTSFKIK